MTHREEFDAWMAEVDLEVLDIAGVSVHDLADYRFMDDFNDGAFPEETALNVLDENGWTE